MSEQVENNKSQPIVVRLINTDVNDKFSEHPSEGLNPKRLARILKEANEGNVRSQMELFEDIEEKDAHLFSQLQTRKLAVTGLEWEVQPFSDDARDKEIADFIENELKQIEDLESVFIDLLDAIGKGISIMEIVWTKENNAVHVEDIEYVHPKKLLWDPLTDEMKICTLESPFGMSIPENKFLVHKYKAKSGHPSRAGVLRIVAWMYMFKNYDIKDWIAFCEVFGMPLRLGKYAQSASDDDKDALAQALYDIGADAAGIIPEGAEIEFVECNKTTSIELYEKFARYCDEQISKAIVGQTLTSDSGGSYAQSKTHDKVRMDITKADARALSNTIRKCLIRPLVVFNFGNDARVPYLVFDVEEEEDLNITAEIYEKLNGMGLEIPKVHIYKKFGIPEPESGEAVLEPKQNMLEHRELRLTANDNEQKQVDNITNISVKHGEKLMEEMMKPILGEIDKCSSLEELREALSDKKMIETLFKEMNNPDFDDLLSQGMYLASVIGRTM